MTETRDFAASFSIDPACLKLVVKHADSDHMTMGCCDLSKCSLIASQSCNCGDTVRATSARTCHKVIFFQDLCNFEQLLKRAFLKARFTCKVKCYS